MKNKLVIEQLDRQFYKWHEIKNIPRPRNGWIKSIRKAIGMTAKQLADRLGVSRDRIVRIEKDEPRDALTLRTLREVANHLDCDLIYALIPRSSLCEMLEKKAYQLAKEKLDIISHQMQLESQGVDPKTQKQQIKILCQDLLNGSLKQLWEKN